MSSVPNVAFVTTTTTKVRPVSPADAAGLVDLHARCSEQARYLRFHAPKPRLRAAEADYLAAADGRARVALAATVVEDGEERIVADARFDLTEPGDAEAAFLIRDDFAGRGLGSRLFRHLLELAAALGVRRILLDILPENAAMQALARRFGAEPVAFDGRSVLYAVEVTR
jgi:RimJ/RimL family protein N-acetyltransferase